VYTRRFGYKIIPGQEERALVLCHHFVQALRDREIQAQIVVSSSRDATLHIVEEYNCSESMREVRSRLEADEGFRRTITTWATEFYPLVQATDPARPSGDQAAA
jgi:hypothetical protein